MEQVEDIKMNAIRPLALGVAVSCGVVLGLSQFGDLPLPEWLDWVVGGVAVVGGLAFVVLFLIDAFGNSE